MQDMICDCICVYRKDEMCELGIPVIAGNKRKGFCSALSKSVTPKFQNDNSLIH